MSISYSIHLYFPLNRLDCVLEELIKLSENATDKRMTIRLHDGRKIVVPHTLQIVPSKEKRSLNDGMKSISFTTCLLLEEDPTIKAFIERIEGDRLQNPVDGKYIIGNFNIILSIGVDFVAINILSVSSSQHRILSESEVVHQHVVSILNRCEGLFALLDTETSKDGNYLQTLIDNTKQVVKIDAKESDYGGDIDYIVKVVQRQIAS